MQVSHETIYAAPYVLPRGRLRRELIACLRQNKPMRGRKPKGRERRGKLCNVTNITARTRHKPARRPQKQNKAAAGQWSSPNVNPPTFFKKTLLAS